MTAPSETRDQASIFTADSRFDTSSGTLRALFRLRPLSPDSARNTGASWPCDTRPSTVASFQASSRARHNSHHTTRTGRVDSSATPVRYSGDAHCREPEARRANLGPPDVLHGEDNTVPEHINRRALPRSIAMGQFVERPHLRVANCATDRCTISGPSLATLPAAGVQDHT